MTTWLEIAISGVAIIVAAFGVHGLLLDSLTSLIKEKSRQTT